ncbi:hypothetical protein HPP92_020709 [Vanilla planifolia]|uniref:NAC domain-containing protein n=1 Tax=Vanilla planifolia TaxID=51239 RepID=A0A835PZN1_VANPL|nr:hypothetical protein HPP92_020709 [Vanilla planifolia]
MDGTGSDLALPGFRFHPTEEELLEFYLRRAASGKRLNFDIIGTINLYQYDPWDLPALAKMGEREWYFFVPRDRRQANGGRPNRTTDRGFWKATGSDRPIRSAANPRRLIGLRKTLVYYQGRAPRGTKTEWIMNEYRLPNLNIPSSPQPLRDDIVLCKVYRKATSLKELEQRAAMEESRRASQEGEVSPTSSGQERLQTFVQDELNMDESEVVEAEEVGGEVAELPASSAAVRCPLVSQINPTSVDRSSFLSESSPCLPTSRLPLDSHAGRQLPSLPAIQVPNRMGFDWMQDPFLNQLRSPWLEQWSPLYASLLNF